MILRDMFEQGLWRNRDFRRLWGSLTITHFGGQVTALALPITAALLLDATPLEMGILTALGALPFVLFGLFAGVLVDRSPKLPLVIAADVGRGAVLLLLPVAAWTGTLTMPVLYGAEFLVGTGGVVGWSAYQVLMTERIGRGSLVEANSKIALSESAAQFIGPGIAGSAIQLLTAPVAILLDALSFFASAWMLRGIAPDASAHPGPGAPGASVWADIGEGLRSIRDNALLRSLAWGVALWNLLRHMYIAIAVLFATRELGLSAGMTGAAWMGGGLGCIAASFAARRANLRIGVGRVMLGSVLLSGIAWAIIAATPAGSTATVPLLALGILAFDLGGTLFFINYLSLRQAVTPDRLLGRVVSTMIFLTITTAPLGALLGGALGGWIGLRATIGIAAASAIVLAVVLARVSPLAALRALPRHA